MLAVSCYSQSLDSLWSKVYGRTDRQEGTNPMIEFDGGFLHGASMPGVGNCDIFLLKTNADGDSLTSSGFGGDNTEYLLRLLDTGDGCFIAAGYVHPADNRNECDYWMTKFDSDLDIVWDRSYGGEGAQGLGSWFDLIQTADGGILFVGNTTSEGAGGRDIWLFMTNDTGGLVWDTTYGGENDDSGARIVGTPDGGYAIAGYTKSFGRGNPEAWDGWLLKIDADGDSLCRTYDCRDGSSDLFYDVLLLEDGFLLAGTTYLDGGRQNLWLVRTDEEGNEIWQRAIGGDEDFTFRSIARTWNRNGEVLYALAGYTSTMGEGEIDGLLIIVDELGRIVGEEDDPAIRTYGGAQADYFHSVICSSADSCLVIAGWTFSLAHEPGDATAG